MGKVVWILVSIFIFGIFNSYAQNEKEQNSTEYSEDTQQITIKACILLALKNNLDIKIERFSPRIADETTINALAAFDPTLFSQFVHGRNRETTASLFDTTGDESSEDTIQTEWSVGLRNRFITGTQAELQYTVNRSRSEDQGSIASLFSGTSTVNPRYNTSLAVKITQPLLKNFGIEFNTGNIQIARNSKTIADLSLLDTARTQIASILKTYWDLVQALAERKVNDQSLKRAQRLLAVNKAKQNVGQASAVDVIQAEVGIARQLEDILISDNQILNIESRLKRLILPASEISFKNNVRLKPKDEVNYVVEKIDLERVLSVALKVRPDFLRVKKEIDNRVITVNQRENQIWPTLDAVANYVITGGQETNWGNSVDTMAAWENYQWEVGLVLEYPLGTRAARADWRKSKLELEQSQLRLLNRETAIVVELEEFIRNINTNLQRIEVAKKARQLAEKQLEAEEAKFKVGRSDNKTVLDFQEDLAQAEIRELRAIVSYKKALIDLKSGRGTILEDYDIDFE